MIDGCLSRIGAKGRVYIAHTQAYADDLQNFLCFLCNGCSFICCTDLSVSRYDFVRFRRIQFHDLVL